MELSKNFLFNKIHASALHYTIVVSIIIAAILFFFILQFDLNNQLKARLYHKELLLYKTQNELFSKLHDSLTHVQFWGAYSMAHAKKNNKIDTFKETFLLDYTHPRHDSINLYISDLNKKTVISGNTQLNGNIQIAKGTITSGYVNGKTYSGSLPYVKGSVSESDQKLPDLHPDFIQKTWSYYRFDSPSFSSWSAVLDSLGNSFKKPTLNVYSKTEIYIRNKILKGNIRLYSSDRIEIDSNNTIQDVLITAPEVIIKKGFKGHLHIIAKKIVIEERVALENPSSLIVFSEESSKTHSIHVKEKSSVFGKLIFHQKTPNSNLYETPDITIEKNTTFVGNIYSNGALQFKGILYGQILTDYLFLKESGRIYLNHLHNFSLNSYIKNETGLPLHNAHSKPLKWLY